MSILIFIIAPGNHPSGLPAEFYDGCPFLYTMDIIGSFGSEREFAFPSDFCRKALRNSPVETVWKIFGNEELKVVSGCVAGWVVVAPVDCFQTLKANARISLQAFPPPSLGTVLSTGLGLSSSWVTVPSRERPLLTLPVCITIECSTQSIRKTSVFWASGSLKFVVRLVERACGWDYRHERGLFLDC